MRYRKWLSSSPSKAILIAVLISVSSFTVCAQERNQAPSGHTVRLGIGFSATGILSGLANYFSLINGVDMDKFPVLEATYLYSPLNRVSIGGGIAYQHFALTYQAPSGNDPRRYGLVANRFNIGAIGHFYYVQRSSFKLYSGARLGISNWNVDTETGFPVDALDRIINFALGSIFAPQFIILGGESYFNSNFGVHGELAIGAPHFFGFGLSYRW